MAHPKRRHSVQRQRKRRTHFKLSVPGLSICENCESKILSHRVCPFCGEYKGSPVTSVLEDSESQDKKEG